MKVGIIGSGPAGQALASAFKKESHEVMMGTRNPSKANVVKFKSKNAAIAIGNFEETAKWGELLVLVVQGSAAQEVIKQIAIGNFKNKIIIDATNPIANEPPVNGVLKLFTDNNESLMEKLQKLIPEGKLVKAFNSVGSSLMYKPKFKEGTPTMFICGNDEAAKKTVSGILTAFGWETADMGKAEASRAIEPLSILWCIPGFLQNQWTHVFKLLKN